MGQLSGANVEIKVAADLHYEVDLSPFLSKWSKIMYFRPEDCGGHDSAKWQLVMDRTSTDPERRQNSTGHKKRKNFLAFYIYRVFHNVFFTKHQGACHV